MLIEHPMESGHRRDSQNQLISAHFIRKLTVRCGDSEVLQADWGPGVARNPFFLFHCRGQFGDLVTVSWQDNLGQSDQATTSVS